MNFAILTKTNAEKIISAQKLGHSWVEASFDLEKTISKVQIKNKKVQIREEWIEISKLSKLKEDTCYVLDEGELKSIDFFGSDTNIFYKLKPTKDWPTITLSATPMHRFKTISPKLSAELMVGGISPIRGNVLDTCCGLGYTSILSAHAPGCDEVTVFEIDENVIRIAEYNPYSEELFTNSKIKLHKKSVFEGIKELEKNSFDRIIHDPPTISFAKELYSDEFYKELFRVLKKGGILYHYCPNPGKTKGTEYYPTMIKMLSRNGFSDCVHNPKSSGVIARKR